MRLHLYATPPTKHARQLGHDSEIHMKTSVVLLVHRKRDYPGRVKMFWTLVLHCCGAQRLAGFVWLSRPKARPTRLQKIPEGSMQKKLSFEPKTSLARRIHDIDTGCASISEDTRPRMLPLQRPSLTTNVKSCVAAGSEAKEQGDHGGAELSSNTKGTTNRAGS